MTSPGERTLGSPERFVIQPIITNLPSPEGNDPNESPGKSLDSARAPGRFAGNRRDQIHHHRQVHERLRQSANERDVNWLASTIEKGVNEVYLDDLLDPGTTPLTRRHLRFPTPEIVEWLRKYSSRERVLHHGELREPQHAYFGIEQSRHEFSLRARLALQDQTGANGFARVVSSPIAVE